MRKEHRFRLMSLCELLHEARGALQAISSVEHEDSPDLKKIIKDKDMAIKGYIVCLIITLEDAGMCDDYARKDPVEAAKRIIGGYSE